MTIPPVSPHCRSFRFLTALPAGLLLIASLFSGKPPSLDPIALGGLLLAPLIILAARGITRHLPVQRSVSRRHRHLVPILLFISALAIHLTIALLVFHGRPRLDDGATYLFQARIFATGRL
ncbi:hypothetical protein JW905_09405, partial [bacterium]|nr:hypothetical protein [candidate division CSSED10-310 bacterium]